jgi:hypothetical protein
MARVNVNSQIVDESAVIPAQEGPSSFVLGYLDVSNYPNNILGSLGFTHEREQGYMRISSVGEWHERLKTNQPTGYEDLYSSSVSQDVIGYPFFHEDGKSFVAGNNYSGISFERWPNGPVFGDYQFKFIENYLQYGGQIIIFSQKENENGTSYAIERAKNKKINIDAFVSSFYQYNTYVRNIVNYRQDCIAITSIPSEYKAGSYFEQIPSIYDGLDLESLYSSFAGSTVGYLNYDPVPTGTRKYVLNVPFLKNTGDNVLVSGDGGTRLTQEPVFSVFFKNLIPNQSMFGTSADLIAWENNNSIDNLELAAGIRGCTFDTSNIIESGAFDIEPGITYFKTSNIFNRTGQLLSNGIPYIYGTGDVDGFPFSDQYMSLETCSIGLFLPQQQLIDFAKSESGVTYNEIQHTRIEPGRIGVFFTAKEIYRWTWFNNSAVVGSINTETVNKGSIFTSWVPSNWRNNKFAFTLTAFHNGSAASTNESYEILDGGYVTAYPLNRTIENNTNNPGQSQKSHVSLIDVRDSLDQDLSLLDEIYGPDGTAPDPAVYDSIFSSSGFNVQLTDTNNFKKKFNIYATADTFHEFDEKFWGCTCSQLPEFFSTYGLIGTTFDGGRGITPDICIEFGDTSTTSSVTAEGSTYRAYIGFASKFPKVVLSGPVNIYGEPIGLFTTDSSDSEQTPMSNLIDKLRDLPYNQNPIVFDLNEDGNELTLSNGLLKTILFYPLITPDGWETTGLTHDTENYFYAMISDSGSDSYYNQGPIAPKLIQHDKNWPSNISKDYNNSICLGYESVNSAFRTQEININTLGAVSGITAINSVGFVGAPSNELKSRFFGATANGISNDGIHMLARVDFTNTYPPTEGLQLIPDGANPIYIEDLDYNTLFASNADLYEFPVFGEKYTEDSFEQYKSVNENKEITRSDEISFTSDVAGMFSRLFRDLSPWFSPANQRVSTVNDIIAERYNLSNAEQDDLYDNKINFIKQIDGAMKLWGDKTFANSTSTFSRVNVANLFLYLKKKIEPVGRRFLFEQNDAQSRELFRNAVEPFLQTLKGQRAITDFKVICDETNNTPDIVDSNQFVVEILIKPTKTINYIRLTMNNVGSTFELE